MKKIFLYFVLNAVAFISYSQVNYKWDDVYQVTVGTSKNSAAIGKAGFTTSDSEIRIVGFVYRGDKLDMDALHILVKRDGNIVDSQNISCGKNHKWKDFYLHLGNVIPSDNYTVEVYSGSPGKLLGQRWFYIKKPAE